MTREDYQEVYLRAKRLARFACNRNNRPRFFDARRIAMMVEEVIGQLSPQPASAWTYSEGPQ